MAIPNVVVGELIDPVTFGNAVVNAVNEHETEIENRLPLSGGVISGALKVAGNSDLKINVPDDYWAPFSGTVFSDLGMLGGTQGSNGTSMTSNGYRNTGGKWTSIGAFGSTGAVEISLLPTGKFEVRVSSNYPTGSLSSPPVHFAVTEAGPTFRAQPSTTRSTEEILKRAETAEFPPEDDEGAATMDGHDEVPLFEVVTALLAKVKEQAADIATLADTVDALTVRIETLENDAA